MRSIPTIALQRVSIKCRQEGFDCFNNVDLYNKINQPLVEMILGVSIDESNKEQVKLEMDNKILLFEQKIKTHIETKKARELYKRCDWGDFDLDSRVS